MILKIKNLTYATEHKQVLKNLNLKIKPGKITAILGANGSGKSTLLKLIAGLLDPDKGEILYNNNHVQGPLHKLVPGHPEISLVKQDNSLFPLHTVRENLQYILQSKTHKFQEKQIQELSKLLNLNANLDRALKSLSGGEQQRAAIAAALATGAKLLLLDEPFSQTDIYLKSNLKNHLKHIVEQLNTGILYVTHEPYNVLGFADEIIILNKGKIIETGSSQNIYYMPKKESTAILTGYCNWIPVDQLKVVNHLHRINNNYLLRPDQIQWNLNNGKDLLPATIEKIEFHGIYQLLHLNLQNKLILLSSQISYHSDIKIGQEVYVSFKKIVIR